MTPAQIEAAARELCRIRGEDPDDMDHRGGSYLHLSRMEVERFAQVGTAIAHAMGLKTTRKRKSELETGWATKEDLDAAMRRNKGWMGEAGPS